MLGLFYCIGRSAGKAVQAKLAMPTATATYIFYNIIPAAATAAAASSTTTASTTTTTTTTRSLLKFIAIVFDNKTVDVFTQVRLFNLIYILLFWNLNYLE
jgi:hypothetical protein